MTRRIIAWLAIFGIAYNALWPLIATAAPIDLPVVICTAAKTTPAGLSIPAKETPAGSASPHCPFCLGFSDATPALASAQATLFANVIASFAAMISGTVSAAAFTYPSAIPRGPPLIP
jgi:hypothetical protein